MTLVVFCSIHELIAMFCSIDQLLIRFFSTHEPIFISVASVVTVYGTFFASRKFVFQDNTKVAIKLLKATHTIRDELEKARDSLYSKYEFPEDYSERKATAEEEATAWAHIHSNRWKPVSSAIKEFDAALTDAEVLWGNTIKEKGLQLLKTTDELYGAMRANVWDKKSGGKDFENSEQYGINTRKKFAASPSVDNPLSNDIEKAIKDLESEIRPHLKRR